MTNVIVVPETEEYQLDVSHRYVVWINRKLGVPQLEDNEARYLAPFWIGENEGVNRVYHIVDVRDAGESTEIELGNSFVLPSRWTNIGQKRRFEYHPLADFSFLEIRPGLLIANQQ